MPVEMGVPVLMSYSSREVALTFSHGSARALMAKGEKFPGFDSREALI